MITDTPTHVFNRAHRRPIFGDQTMIRYIPSDSEQKSTAEMLNLPADTKPGLLNLHISPSFKD